MPLSISQQTALDDILRAIETAPPNSIIKLTGQAGTGKTTLIKALVEERPDAVVCTPTNKAAQVLNSKGLSATTFYRRFYMLEEKVRYGQKPRFISCRKLLMNMAGKLGLPSDWRRCQFKLPEGKIGYTPLLIIDEGTMVNSRMLMEMRLMCDTLVLVGDENQLPPPGDDDHPAGIFNELDTTATLTEVRRQEEGGLVLALADAIRTEDPGLEELLCQFEPDTSFPELVKRGAQAIAFTNKERQRINFVCRRILGFDQPYPQAGDRMVITNNYSDYLVNGTPAVIDTFNWDGVSHVASAVVDTGENIVSADVDMRPFIKDQIASQQTLLLRSFEDPGQTDDEEVRLEMTFAYCLTAHKAQGSEWDDVIVFDQRGLIYKIQASDPRRGLPPSEYVRRWFYTAATRARRTIAVAAPWFAQAYDRNDSYE